MSRKCACCDIHDHLVYDSDRDDFYCVFCKDEMNYEEHICHCSEYSDCIPCKSGQRPNREDYYYTEETNECNH